MDRRIFCVKEWQTTDERCQEFEEILHEEDMDTLNFMMEKDSNWNISIPFIYSHRRYGFKCKETPLGRCVQEGWYEGVKSLLNAGARIDALCFRESNYSKGWYETPLAHAAKKGDLRMVKLMVENGACVNKIANKPDSCKTPLEMSLLGLDKNCVEYLIDQGADVNGPGPPLQIAINLLCAYKLPSNNEEGKEKLLHIIDVLLLNGADVNTYVASENGEITILMKAASMKTNIGTVLVKKLIAFGADVNKAKRNRNCERFLRCPLSEAVSARNSDTVKVLINHGAVVSPKFLKLALKDNQCVIAKYLVIAGCEINCACLELLEKLFSKHIKQGIDIENANINEQKGRAAENNDRPSIEQRIGNGGDVKLCETNNDGINMLEQKSDDSSRDDTNNDTDNQSRNNAQVMKKEKGNESPPQPTFNIEDNQSVNINISREDTFKTRHEHDGGLGDDPLPKQSTSVNDEGATVSKVEEEDDEEDKRNNEYEEENVYSDEEEEDSSSDEDSLIHRNGWVWKDSDDEDTDTLDEDAMDALIWLYRHIRNSKSLQVLTKGYLRQTFAMYNPNKVEKLPLPSAMKDYILCKDM